MGIFSQHDVHFQYVTKYPMVNLATQNFGEMHRVDFCLSKSLTYEVTFELKSLNS